MKLKLAIFSLYALAVVAPAALMAGPSASSGAQDPLPKDQIIMLNTKGTRTHGAVRFDHKLHEKLITKQTKAEWPYTAKVGAACVGCHHTINNVGIPQLWKCTVCHQDEGKGEAKFKAVLNLNCDQTGNPKNKDCDEVFYERAFHDNCVGCHRAEIAAGMHPDKAPVTCSGCHETRNVGGGVRATPGND
jgi:cytochrome c553